MIKLELSPPPLQTPSEFVDQALLSDDVIVRQLARIAVRLDDELRIIQEEITELDDNEHVTLESMSWMH